MDYDIVLCCLVWST